jgi:DNA-binding transcriptional ArsR family regulator
MSFSRTDVLGLVTRPQPKGRLMFYEHLATTIACLHPKATWQRDEIINKIWRANAAGQLTEDQAQELDELVRPPSPLTTVAVVIAGPPKGYFIQRSREQRSPDRQASIARRRRLAASGPMPPALASRYTTSEQALARILADEFLAHGVVDLSRNEFGSRAGCSHATAKRALLKFEEDGLIEVERRPRSGRKHLTNLARIKNREWLTWLAHGNRKAVAVKSCTRARPDFKTFRGVKKSPPRAQILRNNDSDRVDKTVLSSARPACAGNRRTRGQAPRQHSASPSRNTI